MNISGQNSSPFVSLLKISVYGSYSSIVLQEGMIILNSHS